MPNQPRTDNPARSFRCDDPLWAKVKERTAQKGETATDVIIRGLEQYVLPQCPHEHVRTFRTVPPHSKCLDCAALVERMWVTASR